MTSQLHKKLRTTLRKTFSNLVSVADNAVRKIYGQSALTVAIASGLALVGLTGFAFAEGWQGQHTSPSQLVVPASSISADAKPIIKSTTSVQTQVPAQNQEISQVSYTTDNSNNWALSNQNIGVKTIRRTVRKTETPNNVNPAYTDPFGDKPSQAAAYGVQSPDVAQVPETNPNVTDIPAEIPTTPVESVVTDPNMSDVPLPDGTAMPELDAVPSTNVEMPADPVVDQALQVPTPTSTSPVIENIPAVVPATVPATEPATIPATTPATTVPATVPATVPVTQEMESATPVAPRTNSSIINDAVPAQDISVPKLTVVEDPRKRMQEHCPPVSSLKPISQITNDISASEGEFPNECTLGDEPYAGRNFQPVCYSWAAPCLAINPLYFEEPALERYGHSWGPFLQPVVSAAHFVVTVPCLPWLMAIDPPNECQYVLGYYRPGECAPYVLDPIPFSVRAAVVEGGVATALIFLIP